MGLTKASYAMINGAPLNILDFGAIGDGATDNTAAFQAAITAMHINGRDVFIPPGTYLTDPLTIGTIGYAKQSIFFGNDMNRCIIRRKTAGTSAFITVGSSSATNFQANLDMHDLTIDGGVSTNGPAFAGYDIVNSVFNQVSFSGGSEACSLFGGVQLTFRDCQFQNAVNGFRARSFTSAAGGGYPNLITISGGIAGNNSARGVVFNNGQNLLLEYVQIENNGTTLGASQEGGVWIGASIGSAVAINEPVTIGVSVQSCWFEANKGFAQIQCLSGFNIVENCNFFTPGTDVSYDLYFGAGYYSVINCTVGFAKTYNLYEDTGVGAGNLIAYSELPGLQYDGNKTTVMYADKIILRSGSVPATLGVDSPMQQQGVNTSGSTTGTVTFAAPFQTGTVPTVICVPQNSNSASTIAQVDIYSVSATGFSYNKKLYNGSTITTGTYDIGWVAFGEF